ncbi:MAG: Rrf2 family transcriptional regulator [Acidobacteria bacterium]|nr:Rrf2 family transcriptional regulator [Acidobacteriota bacterium]
MISKTTILAIRTLMHLAQQPPQAVLTPRSIAEALHESPSYLAKVTRLLVKAGTLRAEKGVHGGVHLTRPAEKVTLLEIVEACEGAILGGFCEEGCGRHRICSYHVSTKELRAAVVGVYSRWTLARLMERPCVHAGTSACLMAVQ